MSPIINSDIRVSDYFAKMLHLWSILFFVNFNNTLIFDVEVGFLSSLYRFLCLDTIICHAISHISLLFYLFFQKSLVEFQKLCVVSEIGDIDDWWELKRASKGNSKIENRKGEKRGFRFVSFRKPFRKKNQFSEIIFFRKRGTYAKMMYFWNFRVVFASSKYG